MTGADGLSITKSYTVEAPPSSKGGKSDESKKLSGGWIFIILLICITFVYCTGGIFYNYKYNDDIPNDDYQELVPIIEFWRGFPEYVRVGCEVSYRYSRGLYDYYFSKGDYEIEGGETRGHKFSSI